MWIDTRFQDAATIGRTGHCGELAGWCICVLHQITDEVRLHDELHKFVPGFACNRVESILQVIEVTFHVLGAGQVFIVGRKALATIGDVVVDKLRNHAQFEALPHVAAHAVSPGAPAVDRTTVEVDVAGVDEFIGR